jgi:hypothetical protein
MSARLRILGSVAVAASALLALPLPASAARAPEAGSGGSAGMDEAGRGVAVDVCGRDHCADLGATGTATGRPFASPDFQLAVSSSAGVRPGPGQCVKVGLGLHLYQSTPASMDTFDGDGQGKLCVDGEGVATVTGRYSGGGVVGDPWMWGSGQGTLTATFGNDGRVAWRATGSYGVSPLK